MTAMLKLWNFTMYPRTSIEGEYQTAEEQVPSLYEVPETQPPANEEAGPGTSLV